MKKQKRLYYALPFLGTILLGLLSRKLTFVPPATGDVLYAVMAYWMFRFVLFRRNLSWALLAALIFCFSIEFLQLLQWKWLVLLRQNRWLRLILGQGFLWSDLLAYISGATLAWIVDIQCRPKANN